MNAPNRSLSELLGLPVTAEVSGISSAVARRHRLLTIPVEGRVVRGFVNADVGDQIRVQLAAVNVERGFIDFARLTS